MELLYHNNSYQLNKIFKMRTLGQLAHPQYQNTRTKAMLEIHAHFRAVHVKENPDLYRRLSELEGSGAQQQIMTALKDSIAGNSANPHLHHFAFLIDRLLALPSFNVALHHHLPQIYCELFSHLVWQRNYAGLEELKVMRKYWMGKLNKDVYWQLHQLVMRYFQVDIERIPESAVSDLKKFYIERLHMSYHDVYLHLPQLKYIEQKIAQNFNKNTPKPKNQTVESHHNGKSASEIELFQEKVTKENGVNAKKQNTTNLSTDLQALKRLRQQSQETTVSIKGTKKIKLEETVRHNSSNQTGVWTAQKHDSKTRQIKRVDVKSVASQYNFLICHLCQFCHLKFELKQQLDKHLSYHQNPSKESEQKQQPKEQKKDCCVTVRQQEAFNYTRTCRGCLKEMQLQFKSGDWIFHNCVLLTIYDQKIIVHEHCSQQFKQSEQQNVDADIRIPK